MVYVPMMDGCRLRYRNWMASLMSSGRKERNGIAVHIDGGKVGATYLYVTCRQALRLRLRQATFRPQSVDVSLDPLFSGCLIQ